MGIQYAIVRISINQLLVVYCNITQNTTRSFISDEWIELPEVLDIFTDGSCLHPQFKDQRIATWGVVCWCGERFWPVSRGVVPGWHQTSLRGEILGITSALAFATRFQRRCRLWVDNLAVYNFVCDCLNQQHDFSRNKDSDFWHHAYLQFQQAVRLGVSVHKVVSHIDANNGDTEVEQWAFLGNAAESKVAEEARLDLPPELWVVWEPLVAHQQLYQQVGQEWQNFLMDVGAKAVVSKQQIRNEPVPQSDDVALTIDENLQKLCDTSFEELPIHFQRECTPILLQWMKNLVAEGGTVRWLSWHQLLIDFQFTTNTPGPKNASGRRWFHMTKEEAIKGYDYPKQALWFAHYWQNMSKANGAPIGYEKRRPYSQDSHYRWKVAENRNLLQKSWDNVAFSKYPQTHEGHPGSISRLINCAVPNFCFTRWSFWGAPVSDLWAGTSSAKGKNMVLNTAHLILKYVNIGVFHHSSVPSPLVLPAISILHWTLVGVQVRFGCRRCTWTMGTGGFFVSNSSTWRIIPIRFSGSEPWWSCSSPRPGVVLDPFQMAEIRGAYKWGCF